MLSRKHSNIGKKRNDLQNVCQAIYQKLSRFLFISKSQVTLFSRPTSITTKLRSCANIFSCSQREFMFELQELEIIFGSIPLFQIFSKRKLSGNMTFIVNEYGCLPLVGLKIRAGWDSSLFSEVVQWRYNGMIVFNLISIAFVYSDASSNWRIHINALKLLKSLIIFYWHVSFRSKRNIIRTYKITYFNVLNFLKSKGVTNALIFISTRQTIE